MSTYLLLLIHHISKRLVHFMLKKERFICFILLFLVVFQIVIIFMRQVVIIIIYYNLVNYLYYRSLRTLLLLENLILNLFTLLQYINFLQLVFLNFQSQFSFKKVPCIIINFIKYLLLEKLYYHSLKKMMLLNFHQNLL